MLLIDGTGLSLEHEEELLKAFPVARNQYGKSHWGMLRVVAMHDVQTGIALRPVWGPMFGDEVISEQRLAEKAIEQAPAGSVIVGDGNFGIFSLAYAVAQGKREVLFRLSKQRALSMGAGKLPPNGEERLCWRPTRHDRLATPHYQRRPK